MNEEIDETIGLPCRNQECPNDAAIFRGGLAYLCKTCASREAKRRASVRRPRVTTECKHGHPWEPGTWRFDVNGTRLCLICQRDASRRYREKKASEGFARKWVRT